MPNTRAFVVSDIHIGGGAADPELEDFDADEVFQTWLESIASPGTTLVLNGDIIDFAQIPPYEVPEDSRLLWTEATSMQKLATAEEAHPRCFDALTAFLREGGRVHVNIGNHDLDMAWPKVQQYLRTRLGNVDAEQLSFSLRGLEYHGVWIEHGHQCTPENCPADPEAFLHEADGERFLERVWGTDFMLAFYNDLERQFPFADNVKPMLTVLYYGLKHRWVGAAHFVRLLLFLKRRGIPVDGLTSGLLSDGDLSAQKLLAQVETNEWKLLVRDALRNDEAFRDELQVAIDELSYADKQAFSLQGQVAIEAGPGKEEAAAVLGLFREERELRAARERLGMPGITHVVFGHTHQPVDGELDGAFFNPGTWIPHLDLSRVGLREKIKKHGVTRELLKDKRLYVTKRYAVQIEPNAPNASRVKLEPI